MKIHTSRSTPSTTSRYGKKSLGWVLGAAALGLLLTACNQPQTKSGGGTSSGSGASGGSSMPAPMEGASAPKQ